MVVSRTTHHRFDIWIIKYRIKKLAHFQMMCVNLNWIGHKPQEFEWEWQKEEFTELSFKEF